MQPLSPFGLTVWPQGQTGREGPRVLEGLPQGGGNCTWGNPHSCPWRCGSGAWSTLLAWVVFLPKSGWDTVEKALEIPPRCTELYGLSPPVFLPTTL